LGFSQSYTYFTWRTTKQEIVEYITELTRTQVAEFYQPKEDSYSIVSPSFSIGGPILRDRLHFFAAYSPDRESSTRDIAYASGGRTFEQTRRRHYSLGRLDFTPSTKLQINASYIRSPYKREGALP